MSVLQEAFAFPGGEGLRRQIAAKGPGQAYLIAARSDAPIFTAMAAAAVCASPTGKPCGTCRDCRKALGGIHPDIRRFTKEKDKRQFSVEVVRRIRSEAYVLPTEANGKAFLLEEADTMNPAAQNAMLKVLEEPPAGTVFLLQCENPGRFLETIRSRCAEVSVCGKSAEENPMEAEGQAFARLCAGEDAVAIARYLITKVEGMDRTELEAFLRAARKAAASLLPSSEGRAASLLARAGEDLALAQTYMEANVSAGHIAGLLLAGGAEMRNKID